MRQRLSFWKRNALAAPFLGPLVVLACAYGLEQTAPEGAVPLTDITGAARLLMGLAFTAYLYLAVSLAMLIRFVCKKELGRWGIVALSLSALYLVPTLYMFLLG